MIFRPAFLAALPILLAAAPAARAGTEGASVTAPRPRVGREMVVVPAGSYRPLYATIETAVTEVQSFAIDRRLVTRAQFLAFVQSHPEWQRGAVKPSFAEGDYLRDWATPTDTGHATDLRRPVTNVSWFAARAYCAAQGKRLPTTDEWEYVAQASEKKRDASRDDAFLRRLAALYASRPHATGITNVYDVSDMHAPVWEWTLDFNDVVVSDDSRTSGGGVDARSHDVFCASAALGATNLTNYPAFLRAAMRAGLNGRATLDGLGFRCAASVA